MTIRLDDPRLAAELVSLVDRRVAAALAAGRVTRYGVVAAVDAAASTCSVYLGASTTASPGFVTAPWQVVKVGDRVRVVMAGADRYVDANLSGAAPLTFVPVQTQIIVQNSWTGNVAEALQHAGAPAGAKAVQVMALIQQQASGPHGSNGMHIRHPDQPVGSIGTIALWTPPSGTGTWNATQGLVALNAAGEFIWQRTWGAGTVQGRIYRVGYWI